MKLVIFDVDGTLTKKDSLMQFLIFGIKKVKLRFLFIIPLYVALRVKIVSNLKFKQLIAKYCFGGYKYQDLLNLIEQWAQSSGFKSNFRIELLNSIKKYKANKAQIILLSANYDIIIAAIARYLEIETFYTANLQVLNNIFTGEIEGKIIHGAEKVNVIQRNYQQNQINTAIAYGNEPSDLHLLKIVNTAYYVNNNEIKQLN